MYRHARANRLLRPRTGSLPLLASLALLLPAEGSGQTEALRLVAEPTSVEVMVGRSAPLTVEVIDASGQTVDVAVRFAAPRGALRVRDGRVQGLAAGTYEIVATAAFAPEATATAEALTITVTVAWPPIARLDVDASSDRIFVGTTVTHGADAYHADDSRRPGAVVS